MKKILSIFVLLLVANSLFAQKVWTGNVNNSWNNQNNWSGNNRPSNNDDIIIDTVNYTNAPVITGNSSFNPGNVTVRNGATLAIDGNIDINDNLLIQSGSKVTVTKDLDVKDNLTVSGSGSSILFTDARLQVEKDILIDSGAAINRTGNSNLIAKGTLTISGEGSELTGDGGNVELEKALTITGGGKLEQTSGKLTAKKEVNISGGNSNLQFKGSEFTAEKEINISGGADMALDSGKATLKQGLNVSGGESKFSYGGNDFVSEKEVTISDGANLTFDSTAQSIKFKKDLVVKGTGTTMDINGGNFDFENNDLIVQDSAVATQTGGTIDASDATLVTEGKFNFGGGTLDNMDDLVVPAGTTFEISGGTVSFDNIDVQGTLIVSGGDITVNDNFDIYNGGKLNMLGGTINVSNFPVDLDGATSSINISGGQLNATKAFNITNGATLNLSNTGRLDVTDDLTVDNGSVNISGTATLNANDKIVLDAANSELTVNGGTVNITDELVLTGANCGCGTTKLTVNDGVFNSPSVNFANSSSTVDLQSINITGGTANIGTLNKSGNSSSRILVNQSGGNLVLTDDLTLSANDIINQADGDLTLKGDYNQQGGTYSAGGKIVFNGTSAQTINGASSQVFSILEVNNSEGVTLLKPVKVTDGLILTEGILNTTSANILTVTDNTVLTGGGNNSHVKGPMVGENLTQAKVFPVGNGYRWARLETGVPTSTSSYQVEYFSTTPPNSGSYDPAITGISTFEYWGVERVNGSGTADIKLHWANNDSTGIYNSIDDLVIAENVGGTWESMGQASNSGTIMPSGWIKSSDNGNMSNYYTFGKTGGFEPLPVEWLYFDAYADNGSVVLEWGTASEQNNDYFLIERTADGKTFEVVGTVKGNGNSANIIEYSYTDYSPLSGESFYRITQVDYNGESESTDWEKVNLGNVVTKLQAQVTVYPNPANINMPVNYTLEGFAAGDVTVQVQSQTGAVVSNQVLNNLNGVIDLSNINKPGIYFVTFSQGEVVSKTKLIIQ